MTTTFLSEKVWAELTEAVSNSKRQCFAAVAYFAKGASSQLPLPKGSLLVVNASDSMVAAGVTCPAELIKLLNRGVRIFNEPKLHAKVFVVGKTAYIGSINVSQHSASHWIEAAIRTTDPDAVRAARKFVEDHCNNQMGPERLKELQKIYRDPLVPGGRIGKGKTRKSASGKTIPRLLLAQLKLEDYSEQEQELCDEGEIVAKQNSQHPRSWIQESILWEGKNPFRQEDLVIQVTNEGSGKFLVAGTASVLHVLPPQKLGTKYVSFVYLERPNQKRRGLKSIAEKVGCSQKLLKTNGLVRNLLFANRLRKVFSKVS
jgi:hypothetical protein